MLLVLFYNRQMRHVAIENMLILHSTTYTIKIPDYFQMSWFAQKAPQSTAPWRDSNSPQKLYYCVTMILHPSRDECRCTTCDKLSVTQETCGRDSHASAGNRLEARLTCFIMFPKESWGGGHCVSGGTWHHGHLLILCIEAFGLLCLLSQPQSGGSSWVQPKSWFIKDWLEKLSCLSLWVPPYMPKDSINIVSSNTVRWMRASLLTAYAAQSQWELFTALRLCCHRMVWLP